MGRMRSAGAAKLLFRMMNKYVFDYHEIIYKKCAFKPALTIPISIKFSKFNYVKYLSPKNINKLKKFNIYFRGYDEAKTLKIPK